MAELLIVMPVYNDWASCADLLIALDEVLAKSGQSASVLIVDDASHVRVPDSLGTVRRRAICQIDTLRLRRNLGHQRAICIGLAYVEEHTSYETVVVMDADGEDQPEDVIRLIARAHEERGQAVVFAERTRRSESWAFRVFYRIYRAVHRMLTGHHVRVGNFCVIPRRSLESLVAVSELWSHCAAAIFHSRLPHCSVPTVRGRRLHGKSKMDFVRLVVHGMTAMSVFSDVIGVRLLIVSWLLVILATAGILGVVGVRLFTDLAIPGWATFTAGILLLILLQAVMFSVIFSFVILSTRTGTSFLPVRDYAYFVGETETIWERPAHLSIPEAN